LHDRPPASSPRRPGRFAIRPFLIVLRARRAVSDKDKKNRPVGRLVAPCDVRRSQANSVERLESRVTPESRPAKSNFSIRPIECGDLSLQFLADRHGAVARPTHRAEGRFLMGLPGQCLVVVSPRTLWIQ